MTNNCHQSLTKSDVADEKYTAPLSNWIGNHQVIKNLVFLKIFRYSFHTLQS